jgi:hypothetical protein
MFAQSDIQIVLLKAEQVWNEVTIGSHGLTQFLGGSFYLTGAIQG